VLGSFGHERQTEDSTPQQQTADSNSEQQTADSNSNSQNTETTDRTETTRISPPGGEAGAADGIAFE